MLGRHKLDGKRGVRGVTSLVVSEHPDMGDAIDTGKNYMYPKVLSLFETVIYKLYCIV